MRDINARDGQNLGGIIRFRFIPVSLVEAVVVTAGVVTQVVLPRGVDWFNGWAKQNTAGYSEPGTMSNAGTIYKRMFVAFCPQEGQNDDLFNEMRNQQFLIDYTNSNGVRKLIGNMEEPLSFEEGLNTQNNVPGLAGSSIKFFGDGTFKALVYAP